MLNECIFYFCCKVILVWEVGEEDWCLKLVVLIGLFFRFMFNLI